MTVRDFFTLLKQEQVPPEDFWEIFQDLPQEDQYLALDIISTTSFDYQTKLSNEALRKA